MVIFKKLNLFFYEISHPRQMWRELTDRKRWVIHPEIRESSLRRGSPTDIVEEGMEEAEATPVPSRTFDDNMSSDSTQEKK